MPSVPVKSAEQQAGAMILKHRAMLVAQRTQAINALRGHAAEFGVIAAKGTAHVEALLAKLASEAGVPELARAMFAQMGEHIVALDERIATLDKELAAQHSRIRSASGWPRSRCRPVAARHHGIDRVSLNISRPGGISRPGSA